MLWDCGYLCVCVCIVSGRAKLEPALQWCGGATLMPICCKQGQPDQGLHPQISPFTLRSVLYSVSESQRHQSPVIADTRSNPWKKPQHTEMQLLPVTVKLEIMALVCVAERYKGLFQ